MSSGPTEILHSKEIMGVHSFDKLPRAVQVWVQVYYYKCVISYVTQCQEYSKQLRNM